MPIFYKNINTLKNVDVLSLYKRYIGLSKLDRNRLFNVFNTGYEGLKSRKVETINNREFDIIYFLKKNMTNSLVLVLFFLLLLSLIFKMFNVSIFTIFVILISVLLKSYSQFYLYKMNYKNKEKDVNKVKVFVDGRKKNINMSDVLKGDIVEVSSGDIIPSDSIIIDSNNFYISDTIFTGVKDLKEKSVESVRKNSIFDINNIVLKGSLVVAGSAKILVIENFGNNYIDMLEKFNVDAYSYSIFKDILKSLIYIFFIALILFVIKTFFTFKMFSIFMIVLVSFVGIMIVILQLFVSYKYKKYYEYFKDNKIRVKDMMGLSNFNLVDTILVSESFFLSHFKLDKALNFNGKEDNEVFSDFLLNSFYKNSIKNKIDLAVSKYIPDNGYNYEFISSKPSIDGTSSLVLLKHLKTKDYKMINIGDVDSVISLCNKVKVFNTTKKIDKVMINSIYDKVNSYVNKGFLVYLVASKNTKSEIKIDDNNNMAFIGFVLFRRSFKKSLMNEFKKLNSRYDVKLFSDTISSDKMLNNGIVKMNDVKLLELISSNDAFDKFDYLEKRRVVELLKSRGKNVMYVTNDIDDILAFKGASISVTSSKDAILREISDVVLKDSGSIIDFIDSSTYLSKVLENQE